MQEEVVRTQVGVAHSEVLVAQDGQGRTYEYVAGELLVATEDVGRITGALQAEGAERVRDIYGMVVFRLPSGDAVPDVVGRLRALEGAPVVAPNHVLRPFLHDFWGSEHPPVPEDPLPDLPDGDDLPGSGVTVGVLDTGLSLRDWFKSRARRARPGELDAERRDQIKDGILDWEAGHGTAVTGIILQHAPGAEVVVWGVNDRGHLNDAGANQAIVKLVRDHDVDILNLSFGRPGGGPGDEAMERAVVAARALNPDLVVVAAAGNRDIHDHEDSPPDSDPEYVPATYKDVVAVGAVNAKNQVAEYSCRGEWVVCSSKGDDIISTFIDWKGPVFTAPPETHLEAASSTRPVSTVQTYSGFAKFSGTSFAAARVTGAIAAAASTQGTGRGSLMTAKQAVLSRGSLAPGGLVIVEPENFVVSTPSSGD